MSNKLSSKPSKKDRPRSTDKSAKSKKRDGGTPDKMSSPVGSAVHIPDELCTGPSVGKVITGDDIDSLAINVDELKKVHPPKRPPVPKPSTTVMVRKTRLKKSAEQSQPLGKSVMVARPAPPDVPVVSTPLVSSTGPLFDEDGQVLTHTILGSWEDFQQEAITRGDIENLPPFSAYKFGAGKVRPTTKGTKKEKKFSSHVWQTRINENNALTNWQRQMLQRKKQQQHLSNILNTSTDMLVMNQSEDYRETQEDRYAIDRSIPSMDYGKGYRVGSEFWKQVEQIGDDETGINMTLTQTERGYPPAIEHIGKAIYIKNEMGIEWSKTHRSASVHYPWQKSTYLQERTKQLQTILHELDPHEPYIDELEVIGTNQPQHSSKFDMMSVVQEEEEESEMLEETTSERDPLANIADVVPQPIFGPSLSIGGQTAQWNGQRTAVSGQVGVACRVIFDANVGDRVTSHLDICNDGTTAIYFSWKKIPRLNVLGTKLAGQTQRFYFDFKSGVILPGDTLKFPFVFKSPNAGIFTETWEFMTRPTLCGGAPIRITLRGVAVEDDIYKEARQQIEQELAHREAVETAARLLDDILEGVRTPERPRSPVDAYITEEEIFGRANQGMYFQDEVVQELKQIYAQLEEDEDWDLSLQSLQQKIMSVEDADQRDSLLQTLNSSISTLSFPPMTPVKHAMYTAGYQLLCEMVDSIVGQANMIRSILGLPERELVEDTSQEEVEKRLRKGTTSETKADSRKGDKKDKKGGKIPESDRPNSTQRSKLSAKKSGRGTSTPSSQSKSALSETAAERTGTPVSVDGLAVDNAADPVLEAKYRDKLFTQAYALVVDTFDRMDIVFHDIKTAELKLAE